MGGARRRSADHFHPVEEVLTVLAGEAEVWFGDERAKLVAGQSMIVPAGQSHGFHNPGEATLHMHAVLASSEFVAIRADTGETIRRWGRRALKPKALGARASGGSILSGGHREDRGHEPPEAGFDEVLDLALGLERPPQQRSLPLGGHQQAQALRRAGDA